MDLHITVDRTGGLRDGIERALRDAMRDGRLGLGTRLPSSRSLARDLGVARGTVTGAYSQLAAEGYLDIRPGGPTRVRWQPPQRPSPALSPPRQVQPRWDLRPGSPDTASFPRQAWTRAWRQVVARVPAQTLGYGDPYGSPGLREILADYLRRARGVDTDSAHLMICDGFTQALALICHVLRVAGASTVAIEDPSAPRYRRLAEAAGFSVVPVPCDQDGLRVDHLARSGAQAVLVTPAHQYPLGVTMSAARRTALVEWARHRHAVIIEDDYDGEFRYDRQPAGALQHLDPDHVIYVGSASKTLAPGLRLGWLSPPRAMLKPLATTKDHADRGTTILEQLTLAELIASGAFDRHVRRMRATYRRRRDELEHAIAASGLDLQLAGIAAGLHALVYLPERGPSEDQVRSRAATLSIALHTLSGYWHSQPDPRVQAIIVGYASPPSHAYRLALNALIDLLAGGPAG
jgi:GntR family transcriptional regulator / MocR family aminotransferase